MYLKMVKFLAVFVLEIVGIYAITRGDRLNELFHAL